MHEVQTVAVLSTGHLPRDEFERLDEFDGFAMEYEYGWMVWVDTDRAFSMYPTLAKLMRRAQSCNIHFLRFDEAGSRYENLPYFEW